MTVNLDTGTRRRIIGLTGGIATGKTTVAHYLASAYQFPVLDADSYARAAVEPGSAGLTKIVDRYGPEILLSDRTLDRRHLGNIVFSHRDERLWLEAQIHPYVRQRLQAELNSLAQHLVVVVVPLLFEAEMTDLVTEIWVVSCAPAEQIERLMGRDRLTPEQAQARIASQMPLSEKMTMATHVLNNSSTVEILLEQVDLAFQAQSKNSSG